MVSVANSSLKCGEAVAEYEKVLNNYPKSFKLASACLKKGMALIELGQKTSVVRELREVVKRYSGTEEDRRARAKLKELRRLPIPLPLTPHPPILHFERT
jgi:TolA-binding protein